VNVLSLDSGGTVWVYSRSRPRSPAAEWIDMAHSVDGVSESIALAFFYYNLLNSCDRDLPSLDYINILISP
jgi:hypothetical protein